ncbi:chitinase, partial [Streptococcus thermophilus]|nr:chitinase [Streptococcus thermophilus]
DFNLSNTQEGYNVINVSFMKTPEGQTLPTFKPYNKTDAEFRAEVSKLNAEGKSVLIALGGADAHIELKKSQET